MCEKPKPCPDCGRCPTCGKRPVVVRPYVYPQPHPYIWPKPSTIRPYWQSTTPNYGGARYGQPGGPPTVTC